jgi:glucose/arabinose dehydrogenase
LATFTALQTEYRSGMNKRLQATNPTFAKGMDKPKLLQLRQTTGKRLLYSMILLLAFHVTRGQQEGGQIYKTYCAGCHGAELQGNTASKLIKTEWKYGRERGSIIRNIRFGIPETEMISWGTVLKDDAVRAVADYIIAAQETPINATRPIPDHIQTKDYNLKIETLISTGLRTPWSIEFIDVSRALITERSGRIRLLSHGVLQPEPVTDTPSTFEHKTGGYMDIALDPDFATNGWVYLSYSEAKGDPSDEHAPGMTKIVRGKIENNRWQDEQILFSVADSLLVVDGNRWGCRLMFDRDGFLYFSIGDMDRARDSQDAGRPTGKVFRVNPDGTIPDDNPFAHTQGALPAIFTLGNRNVQGITQHPVTGDIWATEHGPMGGDELNILKKGANYGWPLITYGVDYDGEVVSEKTHMPNMEQPVVQWTPSIAVCPAEFNSGSLFVRWKNNLLIGSLAYEELRRLVIDEGNRVTEQEMILKGYGRIRDIKTAPDGALYILLNSPDRIIRITPQK